MLIIYTNIYLCIYANCKKATTNQLHITEKQISMLLYISIKLYSLFFGNNFVNNK